MMVKRLPDLLVRLAPTPLSVSEARRFVAAAMRSWWSCQDDVLIGDVALVTSELVSNAVEHGRGEIVVDLRVIDSGFMLRVYDEGPGVPVGTARELLSPRSRGIAIVEALSSAWGWQLAPGGKWVWAEFPARHTAVKRSRSDERAHH